MLTIPTIPTMPTYHMGEGLHSFVNITPEWIHDCAMKYDKLQLIKALRAITNMGLKDAKDTIELQCGGPSSNDINVQRTDAFFATYFKPIPTSDEMQTMELEQQDHDQTQKLMKALECICNNWRVLGFSSKADGYKAVLKNFS